MTQERVHERGEKWYERTRTEVEDLKNRKCWRETIHWATQEENQPNDKKVYKMISRLC